MSNLQLIVLFICTTILMFIVFVIGGTLGMSSLDPVISVKCHEGTLRVLVRTDEGSTSWYEAPEAYCESITQHIDSKKEKVD